MLKFSLQCMCFLTCSSGSKLKDCLRPVSVCRRARQVWISYESKGLGVS